MKKKNNKMFVAVLYLLPIVLVLAGIASLFWIFPQYSVWQQGMSGKAKLREAEYSRKVKIEEAKANLEAERLNAQSEVVRAEGAAESIKIEGGQLTDNYIKYLWVRQLATGDKQLIYVPTEAGLPLLESTRLLQE